MVTRPTERFNRSGGERLPVIAKMYTTYVLQDNKGKLYKGVTNDLLRRLAEHKRGKTATTARMENLKVVHTEQFDDFPAARKRELYFKSAAGRKYLHKIMGM